HAAAISAVLLIAAAALTLNPSELYPGWRALIPTIAAAVLIVVGADSWMTRVPLSSRPAVFIGLISYPIYLWHWPLYSFAQISHEGIPPHAVRWTIMGLSIVL